MTTFTLSHVVGGVFDYLRHPTSLLAMPGLVAERFIDRWIYYTNQVALTGEGWQLEKTTLNLTADQSEYSINAENFGKPVVVYVLDDEQKIAGELQIKRFRDQIDDIIHTNLPSTHSLPASEVPVSRNSISFFSEGGQQKARLVTTPTESGTLIIHYVPTGDDVTTLEAGLSLLGNFKPLFKVHTALVCLPDCEWKELSDERNRDRRRDIKESLMMEFELFTAQFNEYKSSLFQEQTASREGWGEREYY